MSDLKLEIGKTYKRFGRNERDFLPTFDLVKIIGRVENDTEEYNRGFRFFGDDSGFFTETGDRFVTSNYKETWNYHRYWRYKQYCLEREATIADFSNNFLQMYWISPQKLLDTSKFIPVSDSRFHMKIGGIYVNRMGFVHFIDIIKHSSANDELQFRSQSRGTFLNNGQYAKYPRRGPSMLDIVFQQIAL